MRLPRDLLSGNYCKPKLFLCETDKTRICKLDATNMNGSFKFNSYSELSFDVARVYNNIIAGETIINPYYDKIEAVRLILLEGFGYFELQGPELVSDGIKEVKSCTAYSLEYTLSQKYIENFLINMGTVDSIEVLNAKSENEIVPVTLYNPTNPKLSLLHLALEKAYGWSIGHVDASLRTLSRQFEIDRTSIYDFLMNDVCEKFNCYIVFDTINNTINVYAESLTSKFIGDGQTNKFAISPPFSQIGTVSINGYKTTRWTYNSSTGVLSLEDTPESGAYIEVIDGALTEWGTDVFVAFDNLSQEININYDADSIKTVLTVTYGDDYDIREVNLGLPYLTDISYFYTVDWMGQDLYDAYTTYLKKSNSLQSEYTNNSQEILKFNDHIAYEEHRLSLEYSLVASVNSQTVGTYYTRHENSDGSYYYTEVSLPSEYKVDTDYYSNATTNVNETKVSNLYEVIKKYYYNYFNKKRQDASNEKDELYDGYVAGIDDAIKELEELSGFEFIELYTIKNLATDLKNGSEAEKETAIDKFLDQIWVEIGRTPLKSLYLASYKAIQETNIKAGWSNKNDPNYGYYYPVILFIQSIEAAISQRDKVISDYEKERGKFEKANSDISNDLLMNNNFTNDQLIRLNAFLREDELHIDDIIETDLDNISSSFKIKQDAMESGRIELQKICQPQLQFSMTMANIYALPEFAPIVNQFQLGKVIRVCLRPDYIKQSRLLQVDINFDDFSDFSCEFGELTSLREQSDIHADLLGQAISAGKSVATNSSYWTKGANQATSTDLKIQQGLLDATTQIKAIDGTQGVTIDKYGIRLQKLDPVTGEADPHQAWLVNNMILMSDDGFKTSKAGLGEFKIGDTPMYGLLADAVLAGYVEGSTIVGGEIYSTDYIPGTKGTYINLVDGDFELGSGKICYDANDETLTFKGVTIDWDNTNAPSTSDIDGLDDYLDQLDGRVQTYSQATDPSTSWKQNEYSNHEGDVWFNPDDGLTKIWNGSSWDVITDSELKDLAQSKAQIFTTTPVPPYYIGDLWVQGANGEIMRCMKGRKTGSYVASDWEKASKYTDDVVANNAKSIAENAKAIGDKLVNGLGFEETEITGKYVISPVIAGGYLLIGDKSGVYAEISTDGALKCTGAEISGNVQADSGSIGNWTIGEIGSGWGGSNYPNSLYSVTKIDSTDYLAFLRIPATDTGNVFAIRTRDSDGKVSTPFYVNKNGAMYADNATIKGAITATSLTLGSNASISAGKVTGLSTVATSGRYDDLTGKPTIPTNVGQLGLDTSTIIFKGDITQSTKKDTNGIEYVETVVPSSSGTIKYSTYDADDYIVFGRSKGTNSAGKNYVCIDKDGLLTARNALIYGTIYATDGEFTGKITSESGKISGWNLKDNSIYNSDSDDWSENGTFMCTGTRGTYTIGGGKANNWVFGAGGAFGVTKSGAVWCSDIHATGGAIGGCSIVDGVLQIKNANITEKLTAEQIDGSSLNITKGSTIGGWSVSDSGISYLEYMDNGINFDNGVWFSGTQLGVVLNAGDTWEFVPWRNVYEAAFGYSGLVGRVKELEDNNLDARLAIIEAKLGIVK